MELLYLIAVFYGLFLLVLPVWLIALSARAARLRRELSDVREEHKREQLKLHRIVGELQTKLASLQSAPPATEKQRRGNARASQLRPGPDFRSTRNARSQLCPAYLHERSDPSGAGRAAETSDAASAFGA